MGVEGTQLLVSALTEAARHSQSQSMYMLFRAGAHKGGLELPMRARMTSLRGVSGSM